MAKRGKKSEGDTGGPVAVPAEGAFRAYGVLDCDVPNPTPLTAYQWAKGKSFARGTRFVVKRLGEDAPLRLHPTDCPNLAVADGEHVGAQILAALLPHLREVEPNEVERVMDAGRDEAYYEGQDALGELFERVGRGELTRADVRRMVEEARA